MAKVSRADTVDYVAKLLKSNPDMPYTEVVKDGKKAGYHVYPLIMGLAKNALGMGRKKKLGRRPGRPRGRPAGVMSGRRGRPPKAGGRGFTTDLVRGIERMHSDVNAMRDALRQIASLASKF
jgi:hypothetical protein